MKKKSLPVIIAALVVIITLVVLFMGNNEKPTEVQTESAPETTSAPAMTAAPTVDPNVAIGLAYDLTARIPAEYVDKLVHAQEVHGAVTTEVFSMLNGEDDISLYRIDFGDEAAGDWFGVLNTDTVAVPITYTVFALTEEELTALDDTTQETYANLMNTFNDMLNSISSDPRFSAEKPINVGEDQEVAMAYWTVTLPGNMTWSESNENGEYQAIFYGEVQGARIALYSVRIGETKAETELGLFKVDGVDKPVSVESYDLAENEEWTEDDYSAAYRMMDTINVVIQQLMESEYFSIPVPEEPAA